MTINFEKDQVEVFDKTKNINRLADKIKELQAHQQQLEIQEDAIKQKKKDIEYLSGEVIPTMLSEMGLSFLKLQDGSSVEVKTNYSATTQAKKRRRLTGFVRTDSATSSKMRLSYPLDVLRMTRQQLMLNLRRVKGSNRHKS